MLENLTPSLLGKEAAGLFRGWGGLLLQAAACFALLALTLNKGACLVKASVFTDFLKGKKSLLQFSITDGVI